MDLGLLMDIKTTLLNTQVFIDSDIAKVNMGKARQGKILISNKELNKSFYIFPEELSDYLSKGFYKGRLNK